MPGVDDADDVGAVLRMLDQLAADALSNVARTDDHGVLLVRHAELAEAPGGRARTNLLEPNVRRLAEHMERAVEAGKAA